MITRLKEGHHQGDLYNIIVEASSRVSFEGHIRNLVLHEAANVRIMGSLTPDFVINRGAICHVLGTVHFNKHSQVHGELQVQGKVTGTPPTRGAIYVKAGTHVQLTPNAEVLEVCPEGHLVPMGSVEVIPLEAGPRPWLKWDAQTERFYPFS